MAPDQANIEIVRRGFEAFNTRRIDDLLAVSDPDSEWHPFRAQLEGSPYRGHEGIRQFVRDMDDDWETFQIEPVEFEAHGERVAAVGRITAVGRGSGVQVDSLGGFVFELGGGAIRRLVSHSDPQAALDAVREQDSG
jgi:ketosteroid isomerase-like protein